MIALLFVTLPFVVRTVQPVLIELDQEMEEAAASLGAVALHDVPADRPAEPLARDRRRAPRLSFARAISEFGSTVLISGNLPFKTQVAAVHIYGQIESDRPESRPRSRSCCSCSSLVVLLSLDVLQRWGRRRG